MSPVEVVDPATGELHTRELEELRADAQAIAAELAQLAPEIAEAERLLRALTERRTHLHGRLAVALGALGEPAADGGSHVAVLSPPRRGSQRVDGQVAQRYREELLTLGLGEEATVYKPPTISAVRAARAEIIAAGIDLAALAPEPVPGPPSVELVPKAGA